MTVRVLCTGDIHIGRRASRVTGSYRSAEIWSSIVDRAIQENVDLLALSGDVVDKESKSYEALGPLQDGLSKLHHAGIETVAVTGNHDHDVLVRLAGVTGTDRFHLLGEGGVWERFTLERDGRPLLHVDGWSFPHEHVSDAPMRNYPAMPSNGVPVLGLLHGDVGVPGSRYAPIDLASLWTHPVDAWLLGHIHTARRFDGPGSGVALYPGSPLALDPGEQGLHGPWMVELDPGRAPELRHIPLSPVRYEIRGIDATPITSQDDFDRELSETLRTLGRDVDDGAARVVSARLNISGRSAAYRHLPHWIERARQDLGQYSVGEVVIEIDLFSCNVRPPIDLESLAQGSNPAAETAMLILALDEPEPAPIYRKLISDTLVDIRTIAAHTSYSALPADDDGPGEREARRLLEVNAWHMLAGLLGKKESLA